MRFLDCSTAAGRATGDRRPLRAPRAGAGPLLHTTLNARAPVDVVVGVYALDR